jgi:hypothetical protein
VCVQGLYWKAAYLPGFTLGNRGQPRDDQDDRSDAVTSPLQGCPERLKPKQPQALKGALIAGSRSQDPDPVEGPRDQEAYGSQLLDLTLNPKSGPRLPEVPLGPKDPEAFGS